MTEITRVPLPPLASGTLPKVWLGVFAAVLGGVALAGYGTPPLVDVRTVTPGQGITPGAYGADGIAFVDYVGRLPDGTVFDQANNAPLPMAQMVPGFVKALEQMQVGGKYQVHIPASLGFGDHAAGHGKIPANSDLDFTIKLLDYESISTLRMMEQLRSRYSGGPGGPGAGGPGAAGAEAP